MYLLNHVQGQGLGARMMTEFLTWAGDAPICLWVTDYNDSAVRFYQRHGFKITGAGSYSTARRPPGGGGSDGVLPSLMNNYGLQNRQLLLNRQTNAAA